MRYRSIRDLASGETGEVVAALRPIWLMSPTSVSDTLPLDRVRVRPRGLRRGEPDPDRGGGSGDAPGATSWSSSGTGCSCRRRRSSRSAPSSPTTRTTRWSWGSSSTATRSSSQCAGRLPVDDADVALPQPPRVADRVQQHRVLRRTARDDPGPATAVGAAAGDPRRGRRRRRRVLRRRSARASMALLARPISFHRLDRSPYVLRTNPGEAAYIAGLVADLLRRETGLTIGVVAFSEAQQSEIERALEALAQARPRVRRALRGRAGPRGRRPVRRAVREEPRERPGRRARRHRDERLLRARRHGPDDHELRPDQPGRRREAPQRHLQPRAAAHGGRVVDRARGDHQRLQRRREHAPGVPRVRVGDVARRRGRARRRCCGRSASAGGDRPTDRSPTAR